MYNFAVARVRLRDTSAASNVRVFFRIWQAQQTNASYNSIAYARQTNGESQPIPVLGVQGDEIITIPFFAEPRVTTSQQLHEQTDDFNRHDIAAGSPETDYFFGCWLDINQPNDLYYPQRIVGVSADGPFDTVSPLFPIQRFMVAAHQCLIVEIIPTRSLKGLIRPTMTSWRSEISPLWDRLTQATRHRGGSHRPSK